MCSQFVKTMENYQGDLTDILRATGATPAADAAAVPEWQFPANPTSYPVDDFGDPFIHFRDPLLHDPVSGFNFHSSDIRKPSVDEADQGFPNLDDHRDQTKRPPNIFSRMLQISPTTTKMVTDSPAAAPPRVLKAPHPPMLVSNDRSLISPNNSRSCLVESPSLQISSPRNTGIRRRKSQAKKVVCIPAPAPANSRPTGEIVPSDLWAWRKYGQKPIKGSPYPRGYYRCSSSKGCSARKQVERSRTDPNMLVITYTSEHNHPWPTQRNALAGSTRSQPSKTATAKTSPKSQSQKSANPKEEQKEIDTENSIALPSSSNVKEEMDQDFDHHLEMDDVDQFDEGLPRGYKPTLPDSNQSHEDSFFADLGEIEGDSLDMLLFDGRDQNKALDPFGFYDWAGSTSTTTSTGGATTSYGELAKKDS